MLKFLKFNFIFLYFYNFIFLKLFFIKHKVFLGCLKMFGGILAILTNYYKFIHKNFKKNLINTILKKLIRLIS